MTAGAEQTILIDIETDYGKIYLEELTDYLKNLALKYSPDL